LLFMTTDASFFFISLRELFLLIFYVFLIKIKKNMNINKEDDFSGKFIRFSIGAKLVIGAVIIVLVSFGIITSFFYFMISHNLELDAKRNNFELNMRSSAEIERILVNIRTNAQVLIQIINSVGADNDLSKQAKTLYFEENKQIAAIVFQSSNNMNFLINENFFSSKGVNSSLVSSYFTETKAYYQGAVNGELIFLNAFNHFSMNLLALFFPITLPSASEKRAVFILFAPEYLNDGLSSGIYQSYLVNNNGDILIHPDFEKIRASANIFDMEYFRKIRDNVMQSRQDLRDIKGVKYLLAFTKLKIGALILITGIEYDKIFEEINAVTRRILYLSAAVVLISVLFVRYFSKNVSAELKILSSAAQKIEGGDFNLSLEPKTRDEIGFLTYNFQRMGDALGVFGQFANREMALKAMRGEIKQGGAQKNAVIFFSGIRGFAEKYETFLNEFGRDAGDKLILWLNEYLAKMANCVEKTYGVTDKFIGDSVMAHWGTANASGTPAKDAFNCVKAALMMRKTFVMLNRERGKNPPVNVCCGINSGIVTAGQIGCGNRMEYTVIGEPVSLASEIQALNMPLGTDILISESTWNLVKFFFITEEMPPLKIKGKDKPMRIFAVVNHVSVTSGPKTIADVRKLLGIKPPVPKAT